MFAREHYGQRANLPDTVRSFLETFEKIENAATVSSIQIFNTVRLKETVSVDENRVVLRLGRRS